MKTPLKVFYNDVRARIFYILCLLWLIAIIRAPVWENIVYPAVSIFIFASIDLILTYFTKRTIYIPFSSLVSGLLMGLIIHPSSGHSVLLTAILLAQLSKHAIKISGRHIFNPAAFGIVTSSLIYNNEVSWWAVAEGGIALPIIFISTIILTRIKKLQYPFIFLIGYFMFLAFSKDIQSAVRLTLDGTVFLFSFIMLPEPMTSSNNGLWKWGFGLVVLVIVIINYLLKLSVTDPLLLALLIANLTVKLPLIIGFLLNLPNSCYSLNLFNK